MLTGNTSNLISSAVILFIYIMILMTTFFEKTEHWHSDVCGFLNKTLSNRWIGRNGLNDLILCIWPPMSPDLTQCDYFFSGYVKDTVYIPLLPSTLDEPKNRITTAVVSITERYAATIMECTRLLTKCCSCDQRSPHRTFIGTIN